MQVEVVPTHNLANVVSVSLEGKVTRKKSFYFYATEYEEDDHDDDMKSSVLHVRYYMLYIVY